MKMEGADVRAWVSTEEKIDPPKQTREGKASARARVELATFQSLGLNFGGGGATGGGTGNVHITDKEWKDLAKDIHKPLDCPDMRVLADFFKKHGAIPPFENTYMGDPPMAPGGERDSTSRHYACGNSGAIDLNYPQGIEGSIIDEVRPHLIELGFFTMWQVENHYDHMHVDFGGGVSPTPGSSLGAAGSLTDSFLEVKLVDWDAASPIGLANQFVGGAGGIPFGPPDPADRQRDVPGARPLQRLPARPPRGVGDRDRRVRREDPAAPTTATRSGRSSSGRAGGPRVSGSTGTTRRRRSSAPLSGSSADTRTPGTLAQAVQGSAYPYRYGQRAGQAAALNDKFCG